MTDVTLREGVGQFMRHLQRIRSTAAYVFIRRKLARVWFHEERWSYFSEGGHLLREYDHRPRSFPKRIHEQDEDYKDRPRDSRLRYTNRVAAIPYIRPGGIRATVFADRENEPASWEAVLNHPAIAWPSDPRGSFAELRSGIPVAVVEQAARDCNRTEFQWGKTRSFEQYLSGAWNRPARRRKRPF